MSTHFYRWTKFFPGGQTPPSTPWLRACHECKAGSTLSWSWASKAIFFVGIPSFTFWFHEDATFWCLSLHRDVLVNTHRQLTAAALNSHHSSSTSSVHSRSSWNKDDTRSAKFSYMVHQGLPLYLVWSPSLTRSCKPCWFFQVADHQVVIGRRFCNPFDLNIRERL